MVFGGGHHFVVWSDGRNSGYYQIYGARVTPSGTVLDASGIQIGPNSGTVYQYYPDVAYNGSRYFTVWQYSTAPYGITGRFVATNGVPAETVRVCTPNAYAYAMRLVFDGTNFMLTWAEYSTSYNIKAQRLTSAGVPIGSVITIASGVSYPWVGLCFDGTNYLFTWSQSQMWGRKFDRSGQPVGSAFRISTSVNTQYFGAVAAGTNNRYLNVWSEYVSSAYDIKANVDVLLTEVEDSGTNQRSAVGLKSTVVKDMVILNGTAGRTALVFDAAGRQVGVVRNGRFDCRSLESGIYFVKVSSGEQFKVVKIK